MQNISPPMRIVAPIPKNTACKSKFRETVDSVKRSDSSDSIDSIDSSGSMNSSDSSGSGDSRDSIISSDSNDTNYIVYRRKSSRQ